MKPKPKLLVSSKAKHIPIDWENTLTKNGSFIISYLDESLYRLEKQYKDDKERLTKEKEDLEMEVNQLRQTVLRIFSETK